ncbi:CIR protein [Plasmodium chabaudi chabaudi]|uniref:CIR protein n=1 Tax=Plasmodium chabaudi chabaudi TaxID=31271 RepID=A0A4V0K1K3_PLACU|nr:CIR protein [Plasmodium chabaudi chabaudi]VTZ66330.1 CIR protein [Plasmodium chabaudi chabaudi]|eukprot:XP_016653045.1 CIR protein [Plasmodium chabaudi chabaudi]
MDPQKMCEFLIKADKYFAGNKVDIKEINKNKSIKSYCHNSDCKTNEDSINALAAYIIMIFKRSIKTNEYSHYDECLLMWLSDKLYKMHLKSIGQKDTAEYMDGTTLNQAYDNYLKNYKVGLGYWDLLDMIMGLKEANLKYMAEFYKLLNNICKIITDYNDNGSESKKLSKYSENCLNQYRTLYINIYECKSYLHLLNKLKGIYDDFRNSAINKNNSNNNLATNLQKLTKPDGEEMNAVRSFISYKFNKKICNSLHKKATTSKPTNPPGLPPEESHKSEKFSQSEPNDSDIGPEGSKSEIMCTGGEKGNINGGGKESEAPSGEKCSQVSIGDGENGESADPNIGKGGPEGGSVSSDNVEGGKDRQPGKSSSGSDGGQDDNGGSVSEQGGSDRVSIEKETQSTLGDPFNTGPLIFSIALKGTGILNGAITSFEKIKERITEGADTIKNLYNTSLTNLEGIYNEYSSFLNEIINNISTDPKQVDSPADSDDSKSGSGGDEDNPSSLQKDSPQTSSGSQNSDKSGQGLEKPVEDPVIKAENSEYGIKGNGTIGIGDIYIFKEYKKIGIPIIVIIISITLAIMYKFLVFDRRKKLKRKKMKKVPNLFGVNKTT